MSFQLLRGIAADEIIQAYHAGTVSWIYPIYSSAEPRTRKRFESGVRRLVKALHIAVKIQFGQTIFPSRVCSMDFSKRALQRICASLLRDKKRLRRTNSGISKVRMRYLASFPCSLSRSVICTADITLAQCHWYFPVVRQRHDGHYATIIYYFDLFFVRSCYKSTKGIFNDTTPIFSCDTEKREGAIFVYLGQI